MPRQAIEIPTVIPPYSGATPTPPRVIHESMDGLNQLFDRLEAGLKDNWGATRPVVVNRGVEGAINKWAKGAEKGVGEARLLAAAVANEARNFTLLAYPEKRNFDLLLSYIYPFHFWYNRTYSNWMKRLVYNADIVNGYANYKEALSKIHAGAPEWWKYNINSNELLGLDSDNPLFFNLEATLNPLNGLTGVDFNDPLKRVNWWTRTLDDMNKFGPTTWTPYSLATAMALYIQGEEDAAARWGGRLIPQTATLKSLGSIFNINIPTRAGVNELDPAVLMFSNGSDPYERRRIGRALGMMVEEGLIDQATAIEAARTQSGEAWMQSAERAIRSRAPGQVASFFMGVGFKGRSVSDIQIDRFDRDWRLLWAQSDTLSPDELRRSMDLLREQYPFMDTVLLSRKGGLDRDRSYAYNVLGRIPPGQKDDIAELVGIDGALFDKFYENKGHLDEWNEADRMRFMGGVISIGAILDLPDSATREEWNAAKDAYSAMGAAVRKRFGADIQEKIDGYFARKDNRELADQYLAVFPEVEEALDLQASITVNTPILGQYYGSFDKIERYYKGLMYSRLEAEAGADIFDIQAGYFAAKLEKKEKAYLAQHPELKRYWEHKDIYEKMIAEAISRTAGMLKSPVYPSFREGGLEGLGTQAIQRFLERPEETYYNFAWEDWSAQMSPQLERLARDYFLRGRDFSYEAERQMERIADNLGIDDYLMYQLMENALLQQYSQ